MSISQPPPEFVWSNITEYDQHRLSQKWYIYNFVEAAIEPKHESFRKLAKELSLSFQCIKNKYYSISD